MGSEMCIRDRGSWATDSTIQWLTANAFRFDDISSLHIAQLSSGRSVLDHAGHNDGVQLDIRYADGLGGYSEALGGLTMDSASSHS